MSTFENTFQKKECSFEEYADCLEWMRQTSYFRTRFLTEHLKSI
jgi:hypothetical protein